MSVGEGEEERKKEEEEEEGEEEEEVEGGGSLLLAGRVGVPVREKTGAHVYSNHGNSALVEDHTLQRKLAPTERCDDRKARGTGSVIKMLQTRRSDLTWSKSLYEKVGTCALLENVLYTLYT